MGPFCPTNGLEVEVHKSCRVYSRVVPSPGNHCHLLRFDTAGPGPGALKSVEHIAVPIGGRQWIYIGIGDLLEDDVRSTSMDVWDASALLDGPVGMLRELGPL